MTYEIYLDEAGRRWIRLNKNTIWNSEAGLGGWYGAKGLTKETPNE